MQISHFSRADMAVIRSAVGGPPRRLSAAFLHSERCSLYGHRAACRAFYERRMQTEDLPYPPNVPLQIAVGQTVTARHPRLRTLHDGDVLTASVSTYMVQFHRPELGVAKVPDCDVTLACAPGAGLPAAVMPAAAPAAASVQDAAASHRGDTPSGASGPVRCQATSVAWLQRDVLAWGVSAP